MRSPKNQSFTLRPITHADEKFVHKVHDEAYREVITQQFGVWNQSVEDGYFEEIWSHTGLQIIEIDGRPCGFYCVDTLPNELFIYEMVLELSVQRRGIGTYLLKQLQRVATTQQKPIRLEVLKANTRARALYKRLGFTMLGQTSDRIQMRWVPDKT